MSREFQSSRTTLTEMGTLNQLTLNFEPGYTCLQNTRVFYTSTISLYLVLKTESLRTLNIYKLFHKDVNNNIGFEVNQEVKEC